MARPKKQRLVDGIPLADNLYQNSRKTPGMYRYIRPDGSAKTFHAASVQEANLIAAEANALRDTDLPALRGNIPDRAQLAYHITSYQLYRERIDPDLKKRRSWDNRRYAIAQLAAHFADTPLNRITFPIIRAWWDALTHYQQKLRFAEFRKLFNWLAQEGLTPQLLHNPFSSRDDLPRLFLKPRPAKARLPLDHAAWRAIHKKAGDLGYTALQIAMEISLYTTMREGDICRLEFGKHIIDGQMRVVIAKSEQQKGRARATRLEWRLADHPALAALINRARELSLRNQRCPNLISHRPLRRVKNNKKHPFEVTPDRLSRMFQECRDAAGLHQNIPAGRQPPSFHEIRGLSSALLRNQHYTTAQIQELMAHESIDTTLRYQDDHDLPHIRVTIGVPAEMLAG